MIAKIQISGTEYQIDLDNPIDISIPLTFAGQQPSAYGVEPATAEACEYGSLVGDTRRGGSCNFERITLIPHCNGTHTECVGHITSERIYVGDCLRDVFIPVVLVSVEAEGANDGDLLITRERLEKALALAGGTPAVQSAGLIVRTLPNNDGKLVKQYDENNIPAYFTAEAMRFVVECDFKHLLVDLPSIDRIFDEGKLLNHRTFWNVEPGSVEIKQDSRLNATVTELIYVPNDMEDGNYLLNLQIAPFESDAAPARPVLFRKI